MILFFFGYSLIYDGVSLRLIPALRIATVDTNGAGDVYRGAFAHGILQGWHLERCALYANSAAALQCTRVGNTAVIPDSTAIKQLLTHGTYRTTNFAVLTKTFRDLQEQWLPRGPNQDSKDIQDSHHIRKTKTSASQIIQV